MIKLSESKLIANGKSSLGVIIPKVFIKDHNLKGKSIMVIERGLSREDIDCLDGQKMDCLVIYPKT